MRKVTIHVEDHIRSEADEVVVFRSVIEIRSANEGHSFFEAVKSGQEIYDLAQRVERSIVLKDTCSQEEFIA